MAFLVALVLLALSVCTKASTFPSHAKHGRLWQLVQAESQLLFKTEAQQLWFNQTVDHFASDSNATFQQRYYEVNKFWSKPDGPVILYIGGEGAMEKAPAGFVHVIAQKFDAKILALEHRFYGRSIPNGDLSTENYRYLTVQQALADLKHFKESYQSQLGAKDANQWIAIGGSYPGALSAWFRIAYPDATVASLSSSGVVQPVYKFHQFDEQVALAAGPSCADVLRLTTEVFEKEVASANATAVKKLFGAQDLADADFFYMIADAAAMAVQYGHKDIVCNSMVGAFERNNSLVDSFASFTIDMYGSSFGSECFYDTKCLADDRSRWGDGRSWRWQKCSQLAYFQVAPKEKSLRSAMLDLDYHLKQCQTVFGDVVHPSEGVDEITKLYGGDHPNGHKIFFSNGGDDPWQRASVLDKLSDDQIANLAKCQLCGHCGDLSANPNVPEPLKKQREQILEYLTKWLGESEVEVVENTEMAGLQLAGLHRSSPLVLIPIVVAFLALVGVLHADVVRDAPGGMEMLRYRLAHTHEF
ncbi:serine protease family S28, putative [Phytophthora infestans T30-4]|uniref:Serine protease family S28, putative n=1 Tax=Phytophthora infestans (strain T30-4) TaxID=403677 RepID=D0NAX9_PHYIT|nr:serine protease family S28, putative [Phytophthora infestans T30-4]EEY54987.1 serine protease family S28, putative [Phytophthora infestans T30-4]|eukprot:XP_002903932.1 serine protease family S28, putative [Phytophthora infestans T30-4]